MRSARNTVEGVLCARLTPGIFFVRPLSRAANDRLASVALGRYDKRKSLWRNAMSGNLVDLTVADFDATVANGVTLVDFWATWCGPCQMQTPILEQQVVPAVSGKAKVCKVNVDQARDLAVRFGVKSIPALFIFKNGQVVQQFVGLQRGDALVKAIEAVVGA